MPILRNIQINGSFESDFSGWMQSGSSYQSIDTGIKKFGSKSIKIDTAATSAASYLYREFSIPDSHKVYACQWVLFPSSNTASSNARAGCYLSDIGSNTANSIYGFGDKTVTDTWQFISCLKTVVNGGVRSRIGTSSASTGSAYVDGRMLLDLTALYGPGNEPLQAEMDAIILESGGFFDGALIKWYGAKTDWAKNDYLNCEDMNRIEINTQATKELLEKLKGYFSIGAIKSDRTMLSFDYDADLDRIEGNIEALKNNFYTPNGWIPLKLNWTGGLSGFGYEDANRIENDIWLLYELISKTINYLKYCGAFYCGQDNAFL